MVCKWSCVTFNSIDVKWPICINESLAFTFNDDAGIKLWGEYLSLDFLLSDNLRFGKCLPSIFGDFGILCIHWERTAAKGGFESLGIVYVSSRSENAVVFKYISEIFEHLNLSIE